MAVKAEWHDGAATVSEGTPGVDPFDRANLSAMFAPLSLDIPLDEARDRIKRLFSREKYLFERCGLECPIKDKGLTSCLACPLNESAKGTQKGRLCKVGGEQEQYETLLAVKLEHGV